MKNYVLVLVFCLPSFIVAQDDLLDEIDQNSDNQVVNAAFKGLKIVNFESTKLAGKDEFTFVVSHRFGSVENGFDDFFGLDNAVTKLNFIYGIAEDFNLGIARSSYEKTYALTAKYRIFSQIDEGFPVSIVGFSSFNINTQLDEITIPGIQFSDRLGYTVQMLVSRKINQDFSLQLMPTYFRDNYIANPEQDNSQFVMGIGGRYKLTTRWSLNMDYGYHLNRASNSVFTNPLSIGFDLETGGHVFQMHFTNAQPMLENGFLGRGNGDWTEGVFFFGFNLSRVF
jgi:hypothetical protein